MLKRIDTPKGPTISFTFEGRPLVAAAGDTVASALMLAGETAVRTTPVTGSARGPFCLMGICFDCLVEIDGEPNRQACMIPVRDGMVVRRQISAAEIDVA